MIFWSIESNNLPESELREVLAELWVRWEGFVKEMMSRKLRLLQDALKSTRQLCQVAESKQTCQIPNAERS